MPNTTTSPNMGLVIPTVSVDPGPDWANNINASLSIIDQHNHSPGSGVQINPNGININSDLPMNGNNLTLIRSSRYSVQPSAISGVNDVGCLYVTGVDLYYNDINGTQIQLTSGGVVNATSSGISSGTASASFVAGVLVVNSASNTPANIQCGSVLIGNVVASSKFCTLSVPNSLASNYSLTLPTIPGSQSFLSIDTSGNIAAYAAVSQGLTGSNLTSNVNLSGKAVKENGNNVVVSNTNATNSLSMIRGYVNPDGSVGVGEGYTVTHTGGTAVYQVNFSTSFNDTPAVTATAFNVTTSVTMWITNVTPSSVTLKTSSGSENSFSLIAIGQRA